MGEFWQSVLEKIIQNISPENEKITTPIKNDLNQKNKETSDIKINSEDILLLASKNKEDNKNPVSKQPKFPTLPKQKSKKILLLAIGIGLLAAISWAIGAILTERALNLIETSIGKNDYNSLLGNVARFPVAAILLSLMSIGGRRTKIKNWGKMTWIWLILGALIGTSVGAYLYTEAIQRANAAYVSIISSSSPFVSLPISWFVNREKINLLEIAGVLLTVSGVISLFLFESFL